MSATLPASGVVFTRGNAPHFLNPQPNFTSSIRSTGAWEPGSLTLKSRSQPEVFAIGSLIFEIEKASYTELEDNVVEAHFE
jgi:hypothetical protein